MKRRATTAPLRLGLIGVGRHGSRYIRHIMNDLPEAQLVALCRRTGAMNQPGAPAVPCYTEYQRLLQDPNVEAVILAAPPSVNRDICLAAVQAKKPLLIEKPLATTAADAMVMVRQAREAGVPLMTAQTLRFDSTIVNGKAHSCEVGALRYLSLALRMEPTPDRHSAASFNGRGILLEIGIHLLDLVRFLTGQEVVEARCVMDAIPPSAAESRLFAWLRLQDGCWALLDVSRLSSGRVGRVEWIGASGQLTADWQTRRLKLVSGTIPGREWEVDPTPTIVETLHAFVRSIRDGTDPVISGEDGKRAVEIAEACYESARRSGDTVIVQHG
jgi:predicted dehydrogenase